ncbi:hypothetical protein C8R44DRAFT_992991 [Mycena epipterygia]|nr:hypothetical protein C8R44DRAFT_992991 [Mycena epipterygia]
MADIYLNAHPSRIPSSAPVLSTSKLEALTRRPSPPMWINWQPSNLGAWATMRVALFPELKDSELACWHFNDVDGCSLCEERFREKLQSETGLDYMPPLHLVAFWEYFRMCEDFEERITFAVFQQPHLFLPEIMKPVQELLVQRFPEKTRRTHCLHYELSEHDPVVNRGCSGYAAEGMAPSWQKIEDMIDSVPMFWFDMVQVLGRQYQSQDKGKEASWRPRVSLDVALHLWNYVLGEKLPPLNLELLPEYVQHAVKQFCQATEGDEHTCSAYGRSWGTEYRARYAAAYAQLYSTDLVPLLGDDDGCDACSDIRILYDCVDAISAGQITLESQNIAKVLGFIKKLAVISDDCTFTFPDDRSDVNDSEDDPESSQPNAQQHGGNSGDEEISHGETHESAIVVGNVANAFDATTFTEPEVSDLGWQGDPLAPQVYDNFTGEGGLVEYTMMIEGHTSAHHARELTNLQWDPPTGDSECLPFGGVFPDSSLGEAMGSHVPAANWPTEQPPELIATNDVAGPSRPKDNVGPKISKERKKKDLHAFFVTLFKTHGVPLGTTGMAEARLPWKKMPNILADQGLEIVGWPDGVPEPRSDGKADKGISGFNMQHIAALYQAMKAGQIDFRPLEGGSPTNDAPRVRQREDDMEEVDIRPSKKRKLAETRKMAKAFLAGKSVMKF